MAQQREEGFTLIEAAVAIAVVAILSGIIAPLVVKNIKDSQVARARNDVQVIAGAIGSQYKDTGSRPNAAGGLGASSGAQANVAWYSGPAAAAAPLGITFLAANTFTNLFTDFVAPATGICATGDALFGLPATTLATAEFAYKGPYMSTTDAAKLDPWGHPYIILGYNVTGQGVNGPIYVASAGPDGQILAANVTAVPPATWTATFGTSADDIVVRVN